MPELNFKAFVRETGRYYGTFTINERLNRVWLDMADETKEKSGATFPQEFEVQQVVGRDENGMEVYEWVK